VTRGTSAGHRQGDLAARLLTFALTPVGRIERVDIQESTSDALSGYSVRLLKRMEPFEAFPPEIARQFDRMVITAPFNFTGDH